jgi:hypothetical protein
MGFVSVDGPDALASCWLLLPSLELFSFLFFFYDGQGSARPVILVASAASF